MFLAIKNCQSELLRGRFSRDPDTNLSHVKANSAKDYLEEFCNPLTTFVNKEERLSRGSVEPPEKGR